MAKLKQLSLKYHNLLMAVGVLLLYLTLSALTIKTSCDIVIGTVVGNLLITVFAVFYCRDYPWKADKSMSWKFVPPVVFLLLLVLVWLTSQLTGIALSEVGVQFSQVLVNTGYQVIYLALAVLLASIVEELLFRAILYRHLKDQWNLLTSMLISALVFAVMHRNSHQAVPAFLLGIFYVLVYHLDGNDMSLIPKKC